MHTETPAEAAPQAADTGTAGAQLEVLLLKWGPFYSVGFDDERGWWAARLGRIGSLMTAGEPGDLDAEITEDHATRRPER